jgi:tRNA nucleotidyltransferase/poly(A) polymerase
VWSRLIEAASPQTYLVGGSVRDLLLGRPAHDFDLATAARPEQVLAAFPDALPTGLAHGTVTIVSDGMPVQVTTFRTEGPYLDGRRPSHVSFEADLTGDLARRDFTINAMALALPVGGGPGGVGRWLHDPFGGLGDLAARRVRAVGDPAERFAEDHLRVLRAFRFAAELGFELDEGARQAATAAASSLAQVSAERVRVELERILLSDGVGSSLPELLRAGVVGVLLPELAAGVGFWQNEHHPFDVWSHNVIACANVPPLAHLRWAALLHDVGKPATLSIGPDGRRHFHGHEQASAELAANILTRLRYDTDTIRRVRHLVRVHMDLHDLPPEASDAAVRRAVSRVGREHLGDLLRLRRADRIAAGKQGPASAGTLRLLRRLAALEHADAALSLRDLRINGDQVMRLTGLAPGPAVGQILERLLEAVIDNQELNNPSDLARMVAELGRAAKADDREPMPGAPK